MRLFPSLPMRFWQLSVVNSTELSYQPAALIAAAQEGARIRAVSSVPIIGSDDTRSIVFLARSETARLAGTTIVRLAGRARVPLMVASQLPAYVGALDTVVVMTADPLDTVATDAIEFCRRVGADVVLVGPSGGPVHCAAEGYATIIPDIPGAIGESWCRYVATGISVVGGAGGVVEQLLSEAAECVDREMSGNAPDRDETVNPAKLLAAQMRSKRVVLSGIGAGRPIATMAARQLMAAGIVAGSVDAVDLATHFDELQQGLAAPDEQRDMFYDPYLDGPGNAPLLPLVIPENGDPDEVIRIFSDRPVQVINAAEAPSHPFVHGATAAARLQAAVGYCCIIGG